MATVKGILLVTTSGGNLQPVTTGSYDLRKSPYSGTGIAGTHAANGVWIFSGIDDTAEYKLYDTAGGTEVTGVTGGGSNTMCFYDTDLQTYLNKTTSTPQTVTAQVTFGSSGIKTDIVSEKTSGAGVLIDTVLIKDDIYTGHTGRALLAETNVLLVDANRSADLSSYVYNTIQEAIDYAYSQTPSSVSRWKIFVVPHKNNTGYNESITLYDYIDLYGLGRVKSGNIGRSGTMSDKNCTVENFVFESTDASIVARKTIFRNCVFHAIEDSFVADLTLQGSQFEYCGFFITGGGSVTSGAHSGTYNRYFHCFGNYNISFDVNDINIGYAYNTGSTYQA